MRFRHLRVFCPLFFLTNAVTLDSFRWEYDESLLKVPADAPPMLHGHGLAKDTSGNIYFTYVVANASSEDRCLVKFSPSDSYALGQMQGDPTLSQGTPHGLRIDYESDEMAYLYHSNNDQVVRKTDLNGSIKWTGGQTPPNNESIFWPYMPTDAVVAPPGGSLLFVADGYGSSYIHVMNSSTGTWLNPDFSFGGLGVEHGKFHTPHGINWDGRIGRSHLVVSDRSNARIEYFNLDGTYYSTMADNSTVATISQPCNVDIDIERGLALVPDLDGPVFVLDRENSEVGKVEPLDEVGIDSGFDHPHDAIFFPNGDIAICTWNPGRLGYWRRMN